MTNDLFFPRIEFYKRGDGLVDVCRAPFAPRQGEYINIKGQQWRVAYVSWSLDDPGKGAKQLRANVEMEKVADDEVGPA